MLFDMQVQTYETVKEIFAPGKWNGEEYTEKDIDDMIASFNTMQKDSTIKVPLKINLFDNAVKEDKRHGGMPAVGWVKELNKIGGRLYAHIVGIPKKIKELIDNKAYRQVSIEFYKKFKVAGEQLSNVLTGIALLGVEMPGVHTLDEFGRLYQQEEGEGFTNFIYEENLKDKKQVIEPEPKKEEVKMTEQELQAIKDAKEKAEKETVEAKAFSEQLKAEKIELEKKTAETEAKLKELTDSQRKNDINAFVAKLETEGKLLPKHKDMVIALMTNLNETGNVKYMSEGVEKTASMPELFKSMLDGMPKLIDMKEKAADNGVDKNDKFKEFKETSVGTVESQKMDYLAKKYMEEKSCSYGEALIAVSKIEEAEGK